MQTKKTNGRIKILNRPVIRSRVQNPNPVSKSITTPRNIKYTSKIRNISSNQRINTPNRIPTISENLYQINHNQVQNNPSQVQADPMQTQKTVQIHENSELKKSNGLMSQLTFSQKPNRAKLVSNILMGKLDSQDYSMATTQHEMSQMEEMQKNASNIQIERNMENFKNNLIQHQKNQSTPSNLKQEPSINQFQPIQANLIKINPQTRVQSQSLQAGQRNRSTSNSSRFTNKMVTSNLMKSEVKPKRMKENVMIYKTSELQPKQGNLSNKTLSTSKQRQGNNEDMDNYNFEYSYQDPVYQVYGEPQMDPNQNQYITPHFTNMQMSNPNSRVFKNQQNPNLMQMNQIQESESSSMNTYMTQNMTYLEQQNYMDQHNDMMYDPNYNQDMGDIEENQQMVNPMMYRKNWPKRGLKKFRPHSNNARNLQNLNYPGSGIWGDSKFNQRKFNKNRKLIQASGLSKE